MTKTSREELDKRKLKAQSRTPEEIESRKAYQKAYYEANKQKRKLQDVEYRERARASGQLAVWEKAKKEKAKERYQVDTEFRERRRQQYKSWYDRVNPEIHRARELRKEYGLTDSNYKDLLAKQDGKCAICSASMDKPHVDHCHKSGMVRALLCSPCNRALGDLKDNPAVARRAAAYLELHHPDRLTEDLPTDIVEAPGLFYQKVSNRAPIITETCLFCSGSMTGKLSNAMYCSRICKGKAKRLRDMYEREADSTS